MLTGSQHFTSTPELKPHVLGKGEEKMVMMSFLFPNKNSLSPPGGLLQAASARIRAGRSSVGTLPEPQAHTGCWEARAGTEVQAGRHVGPREALKQMPCSAGGPAGRHHGRAGDAIKEQRDPRREISHWTPTVQSDYTL